VGVEKIAVHRAGEVRIQAAVSDGGPVSRADVQAVSGAGPAARAEYHTWHRQNPACHLKD